MISRGGKLTIPHHGYSIWEREQSLKRHQQHLITAKSTLSTQPEYDRSRKGKRSKSKRPKRQQHHQPADKAAATTKGGDRTRKRKKTDSARGKQQHRPRAPRDTSKVGRGERKKQSHRIIRRRRKRHVARDKKSQLEDDEEMVDFSSSVDSSANLVPQLDLQRLQGDTSSGSEIENTLDRSSSPAEVLPALSESSPRAQLRNSHRGQRHDRDVRRKRKENRGRKVPYTDRGPRQRHCGQRGEKISHRSRAGHSHKRNRNRNNARVRTNSSSSLSERSYLGEGESESASARELDPFEYNLDIASKYEVEANIRQRQRIQRTRDLPSLSDPTLPPLDTPSETLIGASEFLLYPFQQEASRPNETAAAMQEIHGAEDEPKLKQKPKPLPKPKARKSRSLRRQYRKKEVVKMEPLDPESNDPVHILKVQRQYSSLKSEMERKEQKKRKLEEGRRKRRDQLALLSRVRHSTEPVQNIEALSRAQSAAKKEAQWMQLQLQRDKNRMKHAPAYTPCRHSKPPQQKVSLSQIPRHSQPQERDEGGADEEEGEKEEEEEKEKELVQGSSTEDANFGNAVAPTPMGMKYESNDHETGEGKEKDAKNQDKVDDEKPRLQEQEDQGKMTEIGDSTNAQPQDVTL